VSASGSHDAERGSSPVEFVLVGTLLTALTLAVIQLGIAVYVRNVVHDAAVEGAYHAALADTTLDEGAERARQVIERAVGAAYAEDITVGVTEVGDRDRVDVRIRTMVPLIGLIGIPATWEVTAHAPMESLGDE
jgi:Flp pilus assembly protein TadG